METEKWGEFRVGDLFILKVGKANQGLLEEGRECFYIGAKKENNGIMFSCKADKNIMLDGNCLVFICNGEGSVGYANYMDESFAGTTDIVAGYNENLNVYTGLFIATVACLERPKYSFGRKWKTKLADTILKLPAIDEGIPDWQWMEDYMKSLPYSDRLDLNSINI